MCGFGNNFITFASNMSKTLNNKRREQIGFLLQHERKCQHLEQDVIARKMDHSLEAGSSGLVLGASMRKDGTLAKAGHKATEEQMADLSRFVEKKISELAGNMAKGQIDRKPVENACKYCEFRRACPFDPKAQKDDIRQIAKMDDDQFFEAIRS